MWGYFIFRVIAACAIPAASLFFDRLQFSIQKFNLLLLLVDRLIELINKIFRKAQLDFKVGDAIFRHFKSSIFILGID